jgi:TPP-dependent pyruvate/acetoin dehydrogenase alpha subunit
MIEALILHVNGDDPEAVVFAAKVATEYRQQFQRPVVIDMFCYGASVTTKAMSRRSLSLSCTRRSALIRRRSRSMPRS